MKLLKLEGLKSYWAMQSFHALMLGVKMLPMYQHESYEDFYGRVDLMDPGDQEKIIRHGCLFVKLEAEEIESIVCFAADANGVPFNKANLKSMAPDQIFDILVMVCLEIARLFKLPFLTTAEKKN